MLRNILQPHQNTELLDGFLNFLPDDDANRIKTKWTRKGLLPKFPRSKVNGKPLATPENKNNILTGKKRSHSHDNESPHKNQELVKDNEITHDINLLIKTKNWSQITKLIISIGLELLRIKKAPKVEIS